jgi:WD40 repeat protein
VFSAGGSRLTVREIDAVTRNQVLDMATGQPVGPPFEAEEPGLPASALSPDGGRALLSASSKAVRLRDVAGGHLLGQPLQHEAMVTWFQFSPDGNRVLTVSADEAVRVWEADTGLPLTPQLKHEAPVGAARFSPDGRQILTVCGRTARTWALCGPGGRHVGERVVKPPVAVTQASLCPDGHHVVTWSDPPDQPRDGTLWDANTGQSVPLELPLQNGAIRAAFSRDGRRLLIFRQGAGWGQMVAPPADAVRVWDTATGHLTAAVRCEGGCSEAELSPDGTRVLTAHGHGTARLWDAATGAPLTVPLRQPSGAWMRARFSPDGRRVLTASAPPATPPGPRDMTELRVWDAATGTMCGEPIRPAGDNPGPDPQRFLSRFAFSADGEQILTVLQDGTCQFWEANTGRAVKDARKMAGPWSRNPTSVEAINPDGRRVLLLGTEQTIAGRAQVWDAATAQPLGRVLGHKKWITHAEFSPDGGRLLTASGDGTAQVWDAATGEAPTPPLRHSSPVWRAQFSGDGRLIFTSTARSPDFYAVNAAAQEVRVWDATTGQPLTPPLIINQRLQGANDEGPRRWFTSDGRRMLLVRTEPGCAASSQTIVIRDLAADPRPVEDLRAEVEVVSGRRITPTGNVLPLEEDRFQDGWQCLSTR